MDLGRKERRSHTKLVVSTKGIGGGGAVAMKRAMKRAEQISSLGQPSLKPDNNCVSHSGTINTSTSIRLKSHSITTMIIISTLILYQKSP